MEKIVEICCGSYEDALNAYKGNAKRIELNSALYLGGLTPSLASLVLTKKNTDLKVITMIRPRGAGFCYSDEEFESMLLDTSIMLEHGADGIAFGCLNDNKTINVEQCQKIIQLVKEKNKEVVFHRAFDCVNNPYQSIELLIELGVDRLLTSGQKDKAMDGKDLIKDLQDKYGDKIEILAGSGVNASNAKELMEYSNIYQVHSSCKDYKEDATTSSNVSFAYLSQSNQYDVVSLELVQKIVRVLDTF